MVNKNFSPKVVQTKLNIPIPSNSQIKTKIGESIQINQLLAIKNPDPIRYNIAQQLKIKPSKTIKLFKKKIGESITTGDILAEKKTLFKTQKVISRVTGKIISTEKGIVQIKVNTTPREIHSPISGKIIQIEAKLITLETSAETLNTKWGWGPSAWGKLQILGDRQNNTSIESVRGNYTDSIVILGGKLEKGLWHKLCALGIKALVCSQIPSDFDQWRELQHQEENIFPSSTCPSQSLVAFSNNEVFTDTIWKWFNNKVGHIIIVNGEEQTISICKK